MNQALARKHGGPLTASVSDPARNSQALKDADRAARDLLNAEQAEAADDNMLAELRHVKELADVRVAALRARSP